MDDDLEYARELINIKRRRLRELEKRAAYDGRNCPVEIKIEIEDLHREIQDLEGEQKFSVSESKHIPPPVFRIPDLVAGEPISTRPLRIFLCHSSRDKLIVRQLYYRLLEYGLEPWLSEEDILPGQNWKREIRKALDSADVIVVCLSKTSIAPSGYIQEEIKFSLDMADKKPEDIIFIIPLRLEHCDVPEKLRKWQWVDFFEEKGYRKLLRSLQRRAAELSDN